MINELSALPVFLGLFGAAIRRVSFVSGGVGIGFEWGLPADGSNVCLGE